MSMEIEQLKQQLVDSQAREVRLLMALNDIAINSVDDSSERTAREAIAIPFDSTALEVMIAKSGEVMRKRCFDSAQAGMDEQYIDSPPWYVMEACRDAISNLPGVTLEDLK